ncbi:MAG: zinc-ribbon domain containing protein [Rhodocyclaceae bacterium]|nr:zinc-ribbon domain containing protein [Rhodocyclaceae bacterium]
MYQDKTLPCKTCGNHFIFSAGEQAFFAEKGFQPPQRCPRCRNARKDSGKASRSSFTATCARCGRPAHLPFSPEPDRPVYCHDCHRTRKERPPAAQRRPRPARSSRLLPFLLVLIVSMLALWIGHRTELPARQNEFVAHSAQSPAANSAALPPEAYAVMERIQRGQPHPYAKDGTTFFNREGKLPQKPRGYYREYTVPTPGARDRGARRLVTGGEPPEVWYYTADHYQSFQRITP